MLRTSQASGPSSTPIATTMDVLEDTATCYVPWEKRGRGGASYLCYLCPRARGSSSLHLLSMLTCTQPLMLSYIIRSWSALRGFGCSFLCGGGLQRCNSGQFTVKPQQQHIVSIKNKFSPSFSTGCCRPLELEVPHHYFRDAARWSAALFLLTLRSTDDGITFCRQSQKLATPSTFQTSLHVKTW